MASIDLLRVNGYTEAKALYQFMMNAWDVLQEMIHFTEGAFVLLYVNTDQAGLIAEDESVPC